LYNDTPEFKQVGLIIYLQELTTNCYKKTVHGSADQWSNSAVKAIIHIAYINMKLYWEFIM